MNGLSPSLSGRPRGIALILVLWSIFILSLVVLGLANRVNQEILLASRDQRGLEARALAFSGLQVALHPLTTLKTPALRHQTGPGRGYEARILGEGGKYNLNWILSGEDPRKIEMFKRYLEIKGINFQDRERLVDCLLDWVDADNAAHLNGDETALDGRPAPNRPLKDLSELKRIQGLAPLISQPGWEQDFTLISKGQIDLQWASEDVISALPGVGAQRARGFVQQRRGEDRLDGTADDRILVTPDLAAQFLGMSPQEYAAIQDLVTIKDTTVRIISIGRSSDITRTIDVVARKEGNPPQILQWKES